MWRRVVFLTIALLLTSGAVFVFLSSFTVTIQQSSSDTSSISLESDCSSPWDQLTGEPLTVQGGLSRGSGAQRLAVQDAQPLCRDVARSRDLASLGLLVAAGLSIGLALYTPRVDRPEPEPVEPATP